MRVLLVAVGGAAGALTRYAVGLTVRGNAFPWATLMVNLVGSLLLGALLGAAAEDRIGRLAALALSVGFLGAFTTFSTFSWEAVALLRADRVAAASAYVSASVGGGLLAALVGLLAARSALR